MKFRQAATGQYEIRQPHAPARRDMVCRWHFIALPFGVGADQFAQCELFYTDVPLWGPILPNARNPR
jgi:hypothetical protein